MILVDGCKKRSLLLGKTWARKFGLLSVRAVTRYFLRRKGSVGELHLLVLGTAQLLPMAPGTVELLLVVGTVELRLQIAGIEMSPLTPGIAESPLLALGTVESAPEMLGIAKYPPLALGIVESRLVEAGTADTEGQAFETEE